MCSGRQSRPHLFHVVRKVCTKSGHVSTIPPVVKNNSHHGISTIKSDYPVFSSFQLEVERRDDIKSRLSHGSPPGRFTPLKIEDDGEGPSRAVSILETVHNFHRFKD